MTINGHGLGGSRFKPVLVIIPKSLGFRDVNLIIFIEILGTRLPIPVRGFVLTHNEKGFTWIPVFEPVQGNIRNNISGVTSNLFYPLCGIHGRVVVRALSLQYLPEVKSSRIAF